MLKNKIELKKYHCKKFCKGKNLVGKKIMKGEFSK